jgi:uncharacterized membrane protein
MSTGRLEAFSDGVFAIIITIMVLEIKVPLGGDLTALQPLLPVFLAYVLSYTFLGIYWNNHHHMLKLTDRISGGIMWANLHLLFWLSLVPFVTAWMGETRLAPLSTALYGFVLLMSAIAYTALQMQIIRNQGPDSKLRRAVGRDIKGRISAVLYLSAIPLAFVAQLLSIAIYITVAIIWFVPDRRIESTITADQ